MRRSRHLGLVRVEVMLLVVLMMVQGLLHLLLVLIEVLLAGATVRAIVLRSSQRQSGPMLIGGEAVIVWLAMLTLVLLALRLAFQLLKLLLLVVGLLEVGLLRHYFRLYQALVRQLMLLLLCAHE